MDFLSAFWGADNAKYKDVMRFCTKKAAAVIVVLIAPMAASNALAKDGNPSRQLVPVAKSYDCKQDEATPLGSYGSIEDAVTELAPSPGKDLHHLTLRPDGISEKVDGVGHLLPITSREDDYITSKYRGCGNDAKSCMIERRILLQGTFASMLIYIDRGKAGSRLLSFRCFASERE